MTHVRVVVRWLGGVVEDVLCPLHDGASFGEGPRALVAFPGITLKVARGPHGWTLGGHRLATDRPLVLRLGDVEVHFEGATQLPTGLGRHEAFDPIPLVATAALLLLAAWADAAARVVDDHPELAQQVQALLVGAPDDVEAGPVAFEAPRRDDPTGRPPVVLVLEPPADAE